MYDKLMIYDHYATCLGKSQQTVRDWVASGKVKSVSIDGRLYVLLTDEEVKERRNWNNNMAE